MDRRVRFPLDSTVSEWSVTARNPDARAIRAAIARINGQQEEMQRAVVAFSQRASVFLM
jgi:hypothetical protein